MDQTEAAVNKFPTHAEFIDLLGGPSEIEEASEGRISRERAAMWRTRNRISGQGRAFMAGLAEKKGVQLPDKFLDP